MTDQKHDSEAPLARFINWIKGVMGGMGTAVVSEKSKNVPPNIGTQSFKDKPKKGILWTYDETATRYLLLEDMIFALSMGIVAP